MRLLFAVLFFCVAVNAQPPQKEQIHFPDGIYLDFILLPAGNGYALTVMYRVENNSLIFLKGENEYRAAFRVSVELKNSRTGTILRAGEDRTVTEKEYDNTVSASRTTQGYFTLNADTGDYKAFLLYNDINAGRERPYPPQQLHLSSFEAGEPIPVFVSAEGKLYPVNYGGIIPFGSLKYSLIVPVSASSSADARLKMCSPLDTADFNSARFFTGLPVLSKDNGRPEISFDSAAQYRTYLFKDVSLKLWEEMYHPEIQIEGKLFKKPLMPLPVLWLKKPFSLGNIDEAIAMLRIIGKEDEADSLDNFKEGRKKRELFKFWNTLQKPAEGNYNPLMAEFYTRADYAIKNFSSLKGDDGETTDRGKTYIRFGKPDNVSRGVSREGKVTELWSYEKTGRTFLFVDYAGNGNFQLKDKP